MPIKDDSQHVTTVETIGILTNKRKLHVSRKGDTLLVFWVGPLKYIAYGKGAKDIEALPAGSRIWLQSKLTDDKEGVVAFVSRHVDLTHLFELNSTELEPLKKHMEDILRDVSVADLDRSAAALPVPIRPIPPGINILTGKPFGEK